MVVLREITFNVNKFTFDKDTRTFAADASDLGLAPAVWPEEITVVNDIGLEAKFEIRTPVNFKRGFVGYRYTNASTLAVMIYND